MAWYRCLYAPRAAGAYDSHHRTAGTAGRTRRRGGRLAVLGARAAAGDAGGVVTTRVHEGRMQTKRRTAHAGSRLKSSTITRLCGTSMRVPLRRNPYNPNPSEDPWGGGVISLHGGAQPRPRPDTVRDRPFITYSTPSVPLAGTPRFHREAAYTRRLRCAGAPRRPTSGSGLSLLIPS